MGSAVTREDLTQVLVTASMSPDMADHLTEDTLFWIVRARVAVGEVSGINTLLSGVYIGMIQILLPFMILPFYSVMSGIN